MELSNRLARLRQQHGLSQEALAALLNVARQTVSKWESGTVVPELNNLIALSRLYHLTLDRLVTGDDCLPAAQPRAPQEDFLPFLLEAKRATYAGHGQPTASCRAASQDYRYQQGPFCYHDSYFGGPHFAGQEILYRDSMPIWSMTYAGRVLTEPFSGDFLKEALRHGTPAMPWRGPTLYRQGEWTYHCAVQGDMPWFIGEEKIYFRDVLVYEGRFHGGNIA